MQVPRFILWPLASESYCDRCRIAGPSHRRSCMYLQLPIKTFKLTMVIPEHCVNRSGLTVNQLPQIIMTLICPSVCTGVLIFFQSAHGFLFSDLNTLIVVQTSSTLPSSIPKLGLYVRPRAYTPICSYYPVQCAALVCDAYPSYECP